MNYLLFMTLKRLLRVAYVFNRLMKENLGARAINFPEFCQASLVLVAMLPVHELRAPGRRIRAPSSLTTKQQMCNEKKIWSPCMSAVEQETWAPAGRGDKRGICPPPWILEKIKNKREGNIPNIITKI
jgi:hypothetical protein